jgi:hypothetical protein
VANSAVAHLPQIKSIRIDIIKLGLLILLDCLLHSIPYYIVPNFDGKNLFDWGVDHPAEQRDSSRHGGKTICRRLFTRRQLPSSRCFQEVRLARIPQDRRPHINHLALNQRREPPPLFPHRKAGSRRRETDMPCSQKECPQFALHCPSLLSSPSLRHSNGLSNKSVSTLQVLSRGATD